jgi:hypothetical protein
MTDFVEKMRLRELAEEDIFFARRDVELIEALHRRQLAQVAGCGEDTDDHAERAKHFEDRFAALTEKHAGSTLLRAYRELLDEIARVCKHRKR